jgi:hypothetical protein
MPSLRKRFTEGAALPELHSASRPAVRGTKYSPLAKRPLWYGGRARIS